MDFQNTQLAKQFDLAIDKKVTDASDLAVMKANATMYLVTELGRQHEIPATDAINLASTLVEKTHEAIEDVFYEQTGYKAGVDVVAHLFSNSFDTLVKSTVSRVGTAKEAAIRKRSEAGVTRANRVN